MLFHLFLEQVLPGADCGSLPVRAPHAYPGGGVSYSVYKGLDGVSFVHIVSMDGKAGDNPISQLAAFKAFQAGIRDRVEEPPVLLDLEGESIGSYGA